MIRPTIIAAVLSLAAAGVVALAAPASAATTTTHKPCVTHSQYHRVLHGYGIYRVDGIFDGMKGKQDFAVSATKYSGAEQERDYRTCAGPDGFTGTVTIDFKRRHSYDLWRVVQVRRPGHLMTETTARSAERDDCRERHLDEGLPS